MIGRVRWGKWEPFLKSFSLRGLRVNEFAEYIGKEKNGLGFLVAAG